MDHNSNSSQHNNIQLNVPSAHQPLLSFVGLEGSETSQFKLNRTSTDVIMPLSLLAQSPDYHEQWSDGTAVVVQSIVGKHTLTLAETEHHLMLSFQCDNQALDELINEVYSTAYQLAHQHGFKHLIRVWNYLDQINQHEKDIERYQTFCVARHQVLETQQQLVHPNPAATAIGGHYGHNTFVFLFSHQAGQVIENKRQVSAWQYPRQYAPKQPRFSRAMQYGGLLLCSGTASVVGHETIHLDDLAAQFDECLINVQALLDESELETLLNQGIYRFYLRDKSLVDQVVAKIMAVEIGRYVVLEGDICRENLLIECEAVFQSVQKTVKLD